MRSKYIDKYYFGGNREKAILRDGEKCVICGITREEHKVKYGTDIVVDHIDGNGIYKSSEGRNNSLENLQTLCSKCHGKKEIKIDKQSAKPVLQLTKDGKLVKRWESASEAERHGFVNHSINRVANGILHTHRGYKWKFESDNL